ncbi:MAG: hypothetical protein ACRDKS_11285 [Actinomycetota bacterium]
MRRVRGVLRYAHRAAGALLVLAGSYIAYYGTYAIRVERGQDLRGGPVEVVQGVSERIAAWIDAAGAGKLAVGLGGAVSVALLVAVLRRGSSRRSRETVPDRRG